MSSLRLWVGRYREAVSEIRALHGQLELFSRAFARLITYLDEEQLRRLEAELDLPATTSAPLPGDTPTVHR